MTVCRIECSVREYL